MNLPDAFSLEISFPSNSFRLDGPPTYCGIDVSDSIATVQQRQSWMNLAENSVREWGIKLQSSETVNKAVWEMNYIGVSTEEEYLNSGCNIPIVFKPYPDQSEHLYTKVGQFSYPPGFLQMFYLQPTHCLTTNGEFIPCYDEEVFLSNEHIFNILLHEIGHSLSLDHYVSDDNEQNKKWHTEDPAPSIMIPTTHSIPSLEKITDVDIEKVRSIYGANGFYAFSPLLVPTPTPTPIPIPIPRPEPEVPLAPILPFDKVNVSYDIVEVEKYKQQTIRIIGDISKDVFLKGVPVYLTIFKPDLTTEVLKIFPTRKGHFETILLFDHNSLRGFYNIEAYYLDNHDKNVDVSFEVVDKGAASTKMIVPEPSTTPSKQTKKVSTDSKYSKCEKYKNNNSKYEACKKSIDKSQSKTKQTSDKKYQACEKYKNNASKYTACKKSVDKKATRK